MGTLDVRICPSLSRQCRTCGKSSQEGSPVLVPVPEQEFGVILNATRVPGPSGLPPANLGFYLRRPYCS